MSTFYRILRHLFSGPRVLQRAFDAAARERIESLIRQSEAQHDGEVAVVVEHALDPHEIWRGKSGRDRALEVFSSQRIWDTERNNGVLIYVLFADHDIELLADRGIAQRVPEAEWQAICKRVEQEFRGGNFLAGLEEAVREVTKHLEQHFPPVDRGRARDELPDRPVVI